VEKLNNFKWFEDNSVSYSSVQNELLNNKHLQGLPSEFPCIGGRNMFYPAFVSQNDFELYYKELRKPKERIEFVFTHLVKFLLAANFNGAYILIDDFERIPDFQSSRQKKDFALELRSCLFDGFYTNAKIGFYNFLLVLHAGVPRLISDAWAESGMENRAHSNLHISTLSVSKNLQRNMFLSYLGNTCRNTESTQQKQTHYFPLPRCC
jgi:hypothetical protein